MLQAEQKSEEFEESLEEKLLLQAAKRLLQSDDSSTASEVWREVHALSH